MITPSFQTPIHGSSSSLPNDGMMTINSMHPKLKELLSPFLSDESRPKCFERTYEDPLLLMDEHLVDFGCRFRIVVKKISYEAEEKFVVIVSVGVVGWGEVKDHAMSALKTIFGAINVHEIESQRKITTSMLISDCHEDLYNVSIKVNSLEIPQGQSLTSCFESLYNVRSIILGCRLTDQFKRLSNKKESFSKSENGYDESFMIPIQRRCRINHSMVVTSSGSDRIIVVIPVVFADATDKALAKLFLQQFQGAQRMSSAKNAPICDFRRPNDPPREVNSVDALKNVCVDDLAGFISFTFLDNQFQSEDDQRKVTNNLLMILDFLDYHVKCSKSYMHMRMRHKNDILLQRLQGGFQK